MTARYMDDFAGHDRLDEDTWDKLREKNPFANWPGYGLESVGKVRTESLFHMIKLSEIAHAGSSPCPEDWGCPLCEHAAERARKVAVITGADYAQIEARVLAVLASGAGVGILFDSVVADSDGGRMTDQQAMDKLTGLLGSDMAYQLLSRPLVADEFDGVLRKRADPGAMPVTPKKFRDSTHPRSPKQSRRAQPRGRRR